MKISISPQPFVPAMPVIIVAVKDGEKINFAPHGMFGQLSHEPPLMYIRHERTYDCINDK